MTTTEATSEYRKLMHVVNATFDVIAKGESLYISELPTPAEILYKLETAEKRFAPLLQCIECSDGIQEYDDDGEVTTTHADGTETTGGCCRDDVDFMAGAILDLIKDWIHPVAKRACPSISRLSGEGKQIAVLRYAADCVGRIKSGIAVVLERLELLHKVFGKGAPAALVSDPAEAAA